MAVDIRKFKTVKNFLRKMNDFSYKFSQLEKELVQYLSNRSGLPPHEIDNLICQSTQYVNVVNAFGFDFDTAVEDIERLINEKLERKE